MGRFSQIPPAIAARRLRRRRRSEDAGTRAPYAEDVLYRNGRNTSKHGTGVNLCTSGRRPRGANLCRPLSISVPEDAHAMLPAVIDKDVQFRFGLALLGNSLRVDEGFPRKENDKERKWPEGKRGPQRFPAAVPPSASQAPANRPTMRHRTDRLMEMEGKPCRPRHVGPGGSFAR